MIVKPPLSAFVYFLDCIIFDRRPDGGVFQMQTVALSPQIIPMNLISRFSYRQALLICAFMAAFAAHGQVVTPEVLWSLGRVSPVGLTEDGQSLVYKVSIPDVEENTFNSQVYRYDFANGQVVPIDSVQGVKDRSISPDGKWKITTDKVKLLDTRGSERYADLPKGDVYIYDDLHHRHWDAWRDGTYNHLFIEPVGGGERRDIMEGEQFDSPTVPFGGSDDHTWSTDGTEVVYVCKKLVGKEYVNSTNTDLYAYNVATGQTRNLTTDNPGYDTHPSFASDGTLAWLSMARDGYESDKNDLKIRNEKGETINLTANWDGTVNSFIWSDNAKTIYFTAPVGGTVQLFAIDRPDRKGRLNDVRQITRGQWDVSGLVGQRRNTLIAGRTDMNHAKELYSIDLKTGEMTQLTRVNDATYEGLKLSKVEARTVKTTDNKDMLVWVIYPPDFDPNKKYPALLYTQGGPQGALSQFYSFRWNFQVMAAQGYIVVAPNRRGMPGHGVEWNEQISKDYGGQNMDDYLSAIDALAAEPFVDEKRLGCVGASYGGYSSFYLAGIHEGRFQSFISHCGIFNWRSMYGTTEELFFVNWDLGGPYWEKDNEAAQRSYNEFNPVNKVANWDTPILIIQGGKDYRVPESQGLEAFTAAQQLGLKSRLVYFPEENHWVLNPQNGLTWQREFFRWLDDTL